MTATNSVEPAKDGTGSPFNITYASESISGNKAQKHYVGSPSTEGLIEPAQEGVDATGVVQLTGGSGIRGWLSGCFSKLSAILTAIGTPMQATGGSVGIVAGAAKIGSVGIDQTTFGSTNAVSSPPSSSGAIGLAPLVTSALASSLVLKNSAGNLYDCYVSTKATAGWCMVFNATSAPADGAVTPAIAFWCPATATTKFPMQHGVPTVFSTGITLVFSSNADPYTKAASATVLMGGRVA